MSDENNRKIAEFLEPMPTEPLDDCRSSSLSPRKAWIFIGRSWTNPWIPRAFDHEEANGLLLDFLLSKDIAVEYCIIGSLVVARVRPPKTVVGKVYPAKTRQEATTLAFLAYIDAQEK